MPVETIAPRKISVTKPLLHLLAIGATVWAMAASIHAARSDQLDQGEAMLRVAETNTAPKPAAVTVDPSYVMSIEQLNSQIDQTSFVVNKNCSGTLINIEQGFILTANHCIDGQYEDVETEEVADDGTMKKVKKRVPLPGEVTQIDFEKGVQGRSVSYRYDIVARDQGTDLGLVRVSKSKLPNTDEVWIACEAPKRGDKVWAVGNPFVTLYATLSEGIVSSVNRNYGMLGIEDLYFSNRDKVFTQFTAAISPGNSGGALLNKRGELIGVNVRGVRTGNLGFAVSLEDVRSFLKAQDAFVKGTQRVCD